MKFQYIFPFYAWVSVRGLKLSLYLSSMHSTTLSDKVSSIINEELSVTYKIGDDWIFKFKQAVSPEIEIALDDVLSLNHIEPVVDENNTIFAYDLKIKSIL